MNSISARKTQKRNAVCRLEEERSMEYFDRVRMISDDYEEFGIKRGDEGHILLPEIRNGKFLFCREKFRNGNG